MHRSIGGEELKVLVIQQTICFLLIVQPTITFVLRERAAAWGGSVFVSLSPIAASNIEPVRISDALAVKKNGITTVSGKNHHTLFE